MKKLKQRNVWIEARWSNCNFYLKSPQVPWNWKFGFDKSSPCPSFPLGSLKPFWFSGVANDYHLLSAYRKLRFIIVAFLSVPTKFAATVFLFLHFTVFGNMSKCCNLPDHWARMYCCAWNTGCCSVAQPCSTLCSPMKHRWPSVQAGKATESQYREDSPWGEGAPGMRILSSSDRWLDSCSWDKKGK